MYVCLDVYLGYHGGKSVLTAAVIEHLTKVLDADSVSILHFYFRFDSEEFRKPVNMMASLIAQLLQAVPFEQRSALMRVLKNEIQSSYLFAGSDKQGHERNFNKLCRIFFDMLEEVYKERRFLIVLDAIDESSAPTEVVEFVRKIGEFREEKSKIFEDLGFPCPAGRVGILLTGRLDLDSTFSGLPTIVRIAMAVEVDIRTYLLHEVERSERFQDQAVDKDLIINTVAKNSAGMFRYAG